VQGDPPSRPGHGDLREPAAQAAARLIQPYLEQHLHFRTTARTLVQQGNKLDVAPGTEAGALPVNKLTEAGKDAARHHTSADERNTATWHAS